MQATSRHIDYCIHMVSMLRHYGVTPIIVLDGAPLPVRRLHQARRSGASDAAMGLSRVCVGVLMCALQLTPMCAQGKANVNSQRSVIPLTHGPRVHTNRLWTLACRLRRGCDLVSAGVRMCRSTHDFGAR